MIKDPFQRLGLEREVLSVSQLNGRARGLLEDVFAQVWVEGEISNLSRPSSGHIYFTLKDSQAQVRCAFFRHNAARTRQVLRDGLAVRVRGKVSLYEGRGDYQLILDSLEPAGDGALRLAFEALKQQLQQEGLFDSASKKTLPQRPKRIGIISSPTGAVIRDIISVFARRAPQVELSLIPTPVQGREATAQIIKALQLAERAGFDALILARGGGSLEDLWCFNEEALARAIAACRTPIISAVGHETDITIADFVADVRAPTPSAAAELLAPDNQELALRVQALKRRLTVNWQHRLQQAALRFEHLQRRLRHPGERLQQQTLRVDELEQRLNRAMQRRLERAQHQQQQALARLNQQHPGQALKLLRQRLESLSPRLQQAMQHRLQNAHGQLKAQVKGLQMISPLATLSRGYSILLDEQGHAIRQPQQTHAGQTLRARLADGELRVRVEAPTPLP